MASPIIRKGIVLGSLFWISMTVGYVYGQISFLINSLQKNEDNLDISDNDISLIASSMNMACFIGFASIIESTERVGIKRSFIIFSVPLVISWIILYFANTTVMFILSRIIAGTGLGALIGLYLCATAEFTSTKTRAFFLNLITTVAPAVGTGIAHILGFIFHWRTVSLIGAFTSVIAVVVPCFWIESPRWLASKGRFEDCKTSFRKLHESSAESERELDILLKMEKTKLDRDNKADIKPIYKKIAYGFKRKYFWEIMLLAILIYVYLIAAGKGIFSVFINVILEKITGTSDILIFTLSIDSAILLGSLMSCVLIKKLTMRDLLFSSGFICCSLLVFLGACLYFSNGQDYIKWISVFLLAAYFIIFYAGPHPVIEALSGEIFPSDIKFFCIFLTIAFAVTLSTLTFLFFSFIVSVIEYSGLFVLMAAITSVTLVFIWMKLPETKGKTLQEIEVYFKTKDFNVDKILNEQADALI